MAATEASEYVPEVLTTNVEERLEALAETVIETLDERREDWDDNDAESLTDWMVKYHDITIAQFLEHVRILMDNGMTFSAARAYAIEQHTDSSKIGTQLDGQHQAEMTGVSIASHKQLLNEAQIQVSESRGLQYCATSQRPLEILAEREFEGFSDSTKGEFMEEMNPQHHAIRVVVGEYAFNPVTHPVDGDLEVTDAGVGESDGVSGEYLPGYAVFFEVYTGNGVVDSSEVLPIQGRRLHSVETEYCQTPEDVFLAIGEKLQYVGENEQYKVPSLAQKLAGEMDYDGDVMGVLRSIREW